MDRFRSYLEAVYKEAASTDLREQKFQLAHRHMVALADLYEGWSLDECLTLKKSASLLGHGEALRRLADKVGPLWEPPTPERVSVLRFISEVACGERDDTEEYRIDLKGDHLRVG